MAGDYHLPAPAYSADRQHMHMSIAVHRAVFVLILCTSRLMLDTLTWPVVTTCLPLHTVQDTCMSVHDLLHPSYHKVTLLSMTACVKASLCSVHLAC
jgi:hypothetical protein